MKFCAGQLNDESSARCCTVNIELKCTAGDCINMTRQLCVVIKCQQPRYAHAMLRPKSFGNIRYGYTICDGCDCRF
nr:MAG TPA: hypothetical protein [Caudoviricetes sp.]